MPRRPLNIPTMVSAHRLCQSIRDCVRPKHRPQPREYPHTLPELVRVSTLSLHSCSLVTDVGVRELRGLTELTTPLPRLLLPRDGTWGFNTSRWGGRL